MPRNRRFLWILPATEGLPSVGCLPPRQRRRLWKPLPGVLCPLWKPLPTGRSHPYWITQSQRNCRPFGFPARFERSTHKGKMVYGHSYQNGSRLRYLGNLSETAFYMELFTYRNHRCLSNSFRIFRLLKSYCFSGFKAKLYPISVIVLTLFVWGYTALPDLTPLHFRQNSQYHH